MPEIIQKLKSEIKSSLSSSSDHDSGVDTKHAQGTETTAPASGNIGGGVSDVTPSAAPASSGSDPSASAAAQLSDRQTLRKAAEAEAEGAGPGSRSGGATKKKTSEGVTVTPPAAGGVIRSEEAHARDRAQSERMTLRKAAAHDRGEDEGLGA
ncbi:hypothetical protein PG987_006291 [Apiospora arundinis]